MPYRNRRNCPICCKSGLLSLSHHLAQVHQLSSEERKPWLKSAIFSSAKSTGLPYMAPYPFWGMPPPPWSHTPQPLKPVRQALKTEPKQRKVTKLETANCLETSPYPEFKFNHMFSMLVVGPSQCGKTSFVEQLLKKNCIKYPSKKQRRIFWFYNQWQPRYASLQSTLSDEIVFTQGVPALSEDLREINPKFHNVLVFDDLMSKATDSPVLSTLFTQGRHRNASVILLLQNMFPKGKFNTDISRNAQYMVLFRSPSDRKQIDMVAERIFAKDRSNFMKVYAKETEKPYGYLLVDNQPKTPTEKQVVAEVFENCHCYPNITTCTKTVSEADKPELVSRKRPIDPPLVKDKYRKQSEQKQKKSGTIKANPVKQNVESKRRKQPQKKTVKQNINKPTSVVSLTRENFKENPINCEEVPFSTDEEQSSSDEEQFTFNANQLNTRARRHVYARGRGFGPKIVYE